MAETVSEPELTDDQIRAELRDGPRGVGPDSIEMSAWLVPDTISPQGVRELCRRLAAERIARREERSWRCFHCDDVFADEREARAHFGHDYGSEPACKIKAGAEGSLVAALRRVEDELARARADIANESTEAARFYHAQQDRHATQLRVVEELGYERGLADARREERAAACDCRAAVEGLLHTIRAEDRRPPESYCAALEDVIAMLTTGAAPFTCPHCGFVDYDERQRIVCNNCGERPSKGECDDGE